MRNSLKSKCLSWTWKKRHTTYFKFRLNIWIWENAPPLLLRYWRINGYDKIKTMRVIWLILNWWEWCSTILRTLVFKCITAECFVWKRNITFCIFIAFLWVTIFPKFYCSYSSRRTNGGGGAVEQGPWDLSALDPVSGSAGVDLLADHGLANTGARPKNTVESLLGEHSDLVNLDSLVKVIPHG